MLKLLAHVTPPITILIKSSSYSVSGTASIVSTSNLRHLIIYNLVTCAPFRQVIFKWGQVETEIYLPCGQEDFNFFPFPARLGIVQGA